MSEAEQDRALGALLGMAVGDALGTTLEFTSPIPAPFAPLLLGPHTEISGGGPFAVAPGQTTDDTAMAVCIADSLREHGAYVATDVAARYVAWSRVTFDIGAQTRDAIRRVGEHPDPRGAGIASWLQGGKRSAGNGSLMRTTPIGVFFAHNDAVRREATVDDALITHADPRCVLACAAHNGAIAAAVVHGADPEGMLAAARAEVLGVVPMLASHVNPASVESGRVAVLHDLACAAQDDPDLYGEELHMLRHEGFVRVALRLSFYSLLHAPSYEAGLIDVVNRGGDADTNGAIAGALLGARFGAAGIPRRFRDAVLTALSDGPPSPFRDLYHPRAFTALVGAVYRASL